MSRRYSDQPINLILRIPSPEQLSAARPKQRSFVQLVVESGAACVRGLTEVAAQLGRLGRSICSSPGERSPGRSSLGRAGEKVAGVAQTVTETISQSYDRLAGLVAGFDSTVLPVQESSANQDSISTPDARRIGPVAESASLDAVAALRGELAAHRQEVIRLSAQVQELKSLLGAQQQVLVHLGKELETQQMPMAMAAAMAPPPARKTRVVRAKSGAKESSASRKVSREPSLNL
jgi:hypothetical protein